LRGYTDFESALDQLDFRAELQVTNIFLRNQIELLEKQIDQDFGEEATYAVQIWIDSSKALKQTALDNAQEEHTLRKQLMAVADEYKNKAKLKKETKAFFPYDLLEWDDDTSTEMTTALFRISLTALGVQKVTRCWRRRGLTFRPEPGSWRRS
jgi:hypothetical protein